jgi:disulfide bond formation protein DsbB
MNLAFLFQTRTAFFLTLLVAIFALGAALVAQFGFGLKPCIMCLYERVPYVLLILGALAALNLKPRGEMFFTFLFVLLFIVSAGLSFFHSGIEQHWWTLEQGCKVGELKAKSEAEAIAEILSTPQAECDKIAWKLLGFSITVWNTALSLGMAVYLILVAALRKKV